MTFDAVPPGHAPKIRKPKVISLLKLKIKHISKARSGIIENCKKIVIIIKDGLFKTFFISSSLSVIPIPNITKPSNVGIRNLSSERIPGNIKLSIKKKKMNKIKLDLNN